MKKIFLITALVFSLISKAQLWDGTYQTNFGTVKLITENRVVYGDYANNGTIIAYEHADRYGFELHGIFFNGNNRGKFVWRFPVKESLSLSGFSGYYAYDNTIMLTQMKQNRNNFHNDFPNKTSQMAWTGKRTSTTKPNDLQTAVWTGKWTTTFGDLTLEQIGTKVTGLYSDLGNIDAVFDKTAKKLKGTFTNKGRKGYFEFNFEGNSFKGKWGWNTSMTEGKWDGTKVVKTNKQIVNSTASTTTTQNNPATGTSQNNQVEKYRVNVAQISVEPHNLPVAAATQYWWFYGFAGVRVYKVTSSGREEIKSFGNKSQYFFNKTENNPLENNNKTPFIFSDTPDYYRDFEINKTDLNNPNVSIEIELWHHIKVKVAGPNKDYGKVNKTLAFKSFVNKGQFTLCDNCTDSKVYFKITKL